MRLLPNCQRDPCERSRSVARSENDCEPLSRREFPSLPELPGAGPGDGKSIAVAEATTTDAGIAREAMAVVVEPNRPLPRGPDVRPDEMFSIARNLNKAGVLRERPQTYTFACATYNASADR